MVIVNASCARTACGYPYTRSKQMAQRQPRAGALDKVDPVWARIRDEAGAVVQREPELATFIFSSVLHHDTLEAAVIHRIGERLDHPEIRAELIRQAYADALEGEPTIGL